MAEAAPHHDGHSEDHHDEVHQLIPDKEKRRGNGCTEPSGVTPAPVGPAVMPRRWLLLALFSLATAMNAQQWITFSPIPEATKTAFGLDTSQLNIMSSSFMFVYAALFIVTCSVVELWSVKASLVAGGGLTFLGALMKLVISIPYPNFASLFVAQLIVAVGQVFMLGAPPLIADAWFPPNERAVATAIGSMTNNCGSALGMYLAPALVPSGAHATAKDFLALFLQQTVASGVAVIGVFFLVPSTIVRPSTSSSGSAASPAAPAVNYTKERSVSTTLVSMKESPRSGETEVMTPAAAVVESAPHSRGPLRVACLAILSESIVLQKVSSVLYTVWMLLCDKNFVCVLGSFSISVGALWAVSTILAQVVQPFGIGNNLAGATGALSLLGGTFVALAVGKWVDAKRVYKRPLVLGDFLSVVSLSIVCMGLVYWFEPAAAAVAPGGGGNGRNATLDNSSSTSSSTLGEADVSSGGPVAVGAVVALFIFYGMAQNSAIPVCFEFAMEVAYPQASSVPGALLMAGGNIVALVLVSVASAVLGPDQVATPKNAVNSLAIVIGVAAVGTVLALMTTEDLKRLRSERLG